ncbi:MAG: Gldg family protein, partial [Acidimicrobiales bacterium]
MAATGAALAVVVVAGLALDRTTAQWDLTAGRTLTLTAQTRQIVGRVHRPLRITAFFDRADPERIVATTLLTRYRHLNRHLTYRILSPDAAPAEAARLGIDPGTGGLAVVLGSRVDRAQTATEQDLTAAIARLLKRRPTHVCLTQGHGEPSPQDQGSQGLSTAFARLRENGLEPRAVDLLVDRPDLSSCDAVVVADPTAPLGAATPALATYLRDGGRAVVLADPTSTVDLSGILGPWGLGVDRGVVLEVDPRARFPDDPTRPVISSFASPNPIVRRLPPVFFPGVERITERSDTAHGLAVSALARTSRASYLDHNPGPVSSFDPTRDIHGPITVAAAADHSENLGGTVRRTRVVAVGDVDFATHAFVDQAGNATLLVRALDWVTLEDDLITVSTHLPSLRPLDLT